MTSDAGTAGPPRDRSGGSGAAGRGTQARFEFVAGGDTGPVTVRVVGDIDLTNAGQFQAALDQAAAGSGAVTADMTAVAYCDSAAIRALFMTAGKAALTILASTSGPITETLLEVSGLDKIATVVTLE